MCLGELGEANGVGADVEDGVDDLHEAVWRDVSIKIQWYRQESTDASPRSQVLEPRPAVEPTRPPTQELEPSSTCP